MYFVPFVTLESPFLLCW